VAYDRKGAYLSENRRDEGWKKGECRIKIEAARA